MGKAETVNLIIRNQMKIKQIILVTFSAAFTLIRLPAAIGEEIRVEDFFRLPPSEYPKNEVKYISLEELLATDTDENVRFEYVYSSPTFCSVEQGCTPATLCYSRPQLSCYNEIAITPFLPESERGLTDYEIQAFPRIVWGPSYTLTTEWAGEPLRPDMDKRLGELAQREKSLALPNSTTTKVSLKVYPMAPGEEAPVSVAPIVIKSLAAQGEQVGTSLKLSVLARMKLVADISTEKDVLLVKGRWLDSKLMTLYKKVQPRGGRTSSVDVAFVEIPISIEVKLVDKL